MNFWHFTYTKDYKSKRTYLAFSGVGLELIGCILFHLHVFSTRQCNNTCKRLYRPASVQCSFIYDIWVFTIDIMVCNLSVLTLN